MLVHTEYYKVDQSSVNEGLRGTYYDGDLELVVRLNPGFVRLKEAFTRDLNGTIIPFVVAYDSVDADANLLPLAALPCPPHCMVKRTEDEVPIKLEEFVKTNPVPWS